jgi:hypothetical protein
LVRKRIQTGNLARVKALKLRALLEKGSREAIGIGATETTETIVRIGRIGTTVKRGVRIVSHNNSPSIQIRTTEYTI